jgi:hypothetical protein
MEDEEVEFSAGQIAEEPILKFFAYKHLQNEIMQSVSKSFAALAFLVMQLRRSAERSAALRKLLEGKDCAVRAVL